MGALPRFRVLSGATLRERIAEGAVNVVIVAPDGAGAGRRADHGPRRRRDSSRREAREHHALALRPQAHRLRHRAARRLDAHLGRFGARHARVQRARGAGARGFQARRATSSRSACTLFEAISARRAFPGGRRADDRDADRDRAPAAAPVRGRRSAAGLAARTRCSGARWRRTPRSGTPRAARSARRSPPRSKSGAIETRRPASESGRTALDHPARDAEGAQPRSPRSRSS